MTAGRRGVVKLLSRVRLFGVEEGLSRSLSGGGGKPSCPSPSAAPILEFKMQQKGTSLVVQWLQLHTLGFDP